MSEKIEYVAREILAKVPIGYGMTKDEALKYASTAIAAMRKPTPEMVEAGKDALNRGGAMSDIFNAMVDESLK